MDFSEAIGATFREVGKGSRDGQPTQIMRASRTYPTSQDDLWGALTEKDRISRWFASVSGDLAPSGRFAIAGNAEGEITICEPPRKLGLTWELGGGLSWVNVTLEQTHDGALLTLEHEIPMDAKNKAHWAKYGPAATGVGWEMAMLGLDAYLAGGGKNVRDAGMAWAVSAPGKTTLRIWAKAWGKAHVRAGADVQVAKDMAERTANFYTGEG